MPGEILQMHYLKQRNIPIKDFAEAVGCSRKHISNIIHGRARIEADLATKFAIVLETTPDFWLKLQNNIDIYNANIKNIGWIPARVFNVGDSYIPA